MKKLVALTVACMAVMALGACGSSSKNASTDKATTTTAKAVVGANVAADLLKYCNTSKAAQDVSGAATTAGSDLKSSLTNLKANLDAYVAAAPSEIRADVRLQVDKGLKPFIAALEKANYDMTKADLSTLTALGTDAELQAANGRITAYYTAHCK
jgi:hypothetical protein